MAKRPPVDPAIINMNAEALSVEFAEKVTDALSQAGLKIDEIKRSTDITAHFIAVAVSLLQQEPGFQPQHDPKAIYLAFNVHHCYKVLGLFTHAIIFASIKAQALGVTGEPKSVILQGLAQDAFAHAKQLVSATVGQEETPDVQFSDAQLQGWMEQMVASALHHYLGEYEQLHGPIEPEALPHEAPSNRFQNKAPHTDTPALNTTTQDPVLHQSPDLAPRVHPTPHSQDFPPVDLAPAHTLSSNEAPHHERIRLKLAALGLFLSTQSEAVQAEWFQQFPAEMVHQIIYYMDVDHVANELPMQAVLAQLNTFKQTIQHVAQDPASQQQRTRNAMTEIFTNPDYRHRLEALITGERSKLQRFFKTAGRLQNHPQAYEQLPQWPTPLEEAMLSYYQKILLI
ncbi:MAG: hypothetical protein HEQ32_03315 [Vampirovibrio sp.]